ncbi:MAG TPA: ABC transporter substrate-binding protein [Gemmatimonadaceae bacterium]|nr:ABC transporter substrate-binding protein [Gemmatimonadaceae bacterium]
MKRRAFVTGLGAVFAAPIPSRAQERVRRLGYIAFDPPPTAEVPAVGVDALRAALRDLGYIEGRNISITYRWANLDTSRADSLVKDFITSGVDVLVTYSTGMTLRLRRATETTPIVCALCADLVGGGAVKTLSSPGGNVTGLTVIGPDLAAKRLEILKAMGVRRVVCLHATEPTFPVTQRWRSGNEAAASALGLGLDVRRATVPSLEEEIARAAERGGAGLSFMEEPIYLYERRRIATFALKHRIPTVFPFREHVDAGGTVSYGAGFSALFRQTATYVDKIFRGAKPADLPVEQPTKFELVINLKTAKALGLTVPPSLLQRADQVIE